MNQQRRIEVCNKIIFQTESQREDLLDDNLTSDELLACLYQLAVVEGRHLEITAVRTDHRDDTSLGPWAHGSGHAVDLWPLSSACPGDYIDSLSEAFTTFLIALSRAPHIQQIGLAGSANTEHNLEVVGTIGFEDDGADHVHIGAG